MHWLVESEQAQGKPLPPPPLPFSAGHGQPLMLQFQSHITHSLPCRLSIMALSSGYHKPRAVCSGDSVHSAPSPASDGDVQSMSRESAKTSRLVLFHLA